MKNFNHKTGAARGPDPASELEGKIERYARVPHYVLITGERGTGKTTIARRIHEKSGRRTSQFVNLNCASLSNELLESELFGYEKGAFTGAAAPKAGLFEIASGGTLFLDEIGELPFALQAKLLKAVEERRIRRVGSNTERAVDARVIAATSLDLKRMAGQGSFRADLFDRLNILNLETVPLRFQKEKIRGLVTETLEGERDGIGRARPFEVSEEAFQLLEEQTWPGNFREIKNFATRLAVECFDEERISEETVKRVLSETAQSRIQTGRAPDAFARKEEVQEDSSPFFEERVVTVSFDPGRDDLNIIYLKAAGSVISHLLEEADGNLRRAALRMGTTHSTLSRIMKKFKSINNGKQENTRQENGRHEFRASSPDTRSHSATA
jgi:Transcriptional regulator containing PAS, AAA-type ATPase, and DNA-binding domains